MLSWGKVSREKECTGSIEAVSGMHWVDIYDYLDSGRVQKSQRVRSLDSLGWDRNLDNAPSERR